MNVKAIVYTSNTGHTEKYARLFGEKTSLPVVNIKEAPKRLAKNEEIIYFGWLMANHVKDFKKAQKKYNVKAVCAVGLCPTGELLNEVRKAINLSENISLFTLQGGISYEKLKGINKFMIDMLIKMLKKKDDKTEEEKAMLELLYSKEDYVSEENMSAVYEWYQNNNSK